ncbi:MAG TPA: NADH-dependent [FeFe] hydrogenase, group A6 [Spirochaetota bacterium]|nr:NADH-dependent [FeFe] hydrogenase, group A6 [Spirochaetota bacterium]HOM38878.1 NADH-dependent [FeFe] hydrogenase, group A6 [Spirochaetota bacterium]HPQ49173.1 NADH-dependent [FeFe] hydrogenase, group A6 [Spirochaetota bacterium]
MKKIKVYIDSNEIEVKPNITVLEAAKLGGIEIPTLCYHKDLFPSGSCGICIVDIEGQGIKRSCITTVKDGMKIKTKTPEILETRKTILELVLSSHPKDCLTCIKHGNCELQNLAEKLSVRQMPYEWYDRGLPIDKNSKGIVRDMNKCIGCGRCVTVCQDMQTVKAIEFHGRGADTIVAPPLEMGMEQSVCVNCGQCIVYCPVGALYEKEAIDYVWDALKDPEKEVVVQIAPAVRVTLGEEFGLKPGELVVGKIYTALKMLGFDVVFDTNFSADLTILEEGTEFLTRLEKGGPLPLITSCSPGWIKFEETYFNELTENVSTCKSPQQMLGALIKTYYAKENKKDPSKIVSVSIMPCTAKKFEASRPEMNASGYRDVDYVLTTREIARMIREAGIDFNKLPESKPDPLLSSYTGAATIFGATGGVMEAALRTAIEVKTGKTLPRLDFEDVRGIDGIKEASIDVDGIKLKVAVAHGLGNARKLLEKVVEAKKKGEILYHFIEIMACPGGCIGGGGQPLPTDWDKKKERLEGLYKEDRSLPLRKSHENPEVKLVYEKFLGKPNSHKSHELLHTHYLKRDPYKIEKKIFD